MLRDKKLALSPIGIAIAIVCLLGLVMIMSAPMVANKYRNDNAEGNPGRVKKSSVTSSEIETRIQELERKVHEVEQNTKASEAELRNKLYSITSGGNSYTCTIEGVVDESGDMIPASKVKSTTPDTKYVFVCEKK